MGETTLDPGTIEWKATGELEHKTVPASGVTVVDEEKGIVEAFVSVTGTVDRVRDNIYPGAYAKTLQERTPKGVIGHDWNRPVSKTLEVEEVMPGDPRLPKTRRKGMPWDPKAGAVRVLTQYNLETQDGRETFSNVKFYGPEQEWSIGYKVPSGGAVLEQKSGVRGIKELEFYEYSTVLFGAHPDTATASTKDALAEAVLDHVPDGEPAEQPPSGEATQEPETEAEAEVEEPQEPAAEVEEPVAEAEVVGVTEDDLQGLFDAAREQILAEQRAVQARVDELTGAGTPEKSAQSIAFLERQVEQLSEAKLDAHPGDGGARQLARYWAHGEGAAKIGWGSEGDFDRCVAQVTKYMGPQDSKGYCNLRHKEALGHYPGEKNPGHKSDEAPEAADPPAESKVTSVIVEREWEGGSELLGPFEDRAEAEKAIEGLDGEFDFRTSSKDVHTGSAPGQRTQMGKKVCATCGAPSAGVDAQGRPACPEHAVAGAKADDGAEEEKDEAAYEVVDGEDISDLVLVAEKVLGVDALELKDFHWSEQAHGGSLWAGRHPGGMAKPATRSSDGHPGGGGSSSGGSSATVADVRSALDQRLWQPESNDAKLRQAIGDASVPDEAMAHIIGNRTTSHLTDDLLGRPSLSSRNLDQIASTQAMPSQNFKDKLTPEQAQRLLDHPNAVDMTPFRRSHVESILHEQQASDAAEQMAVEERQRQAERDAQEQEAAHAADQMAVEQRHRDEQPGSARSYEEVRAEYERVSEDNRMARMSGGAPDTGREEALRREMTSAEPGGTTPEPSPAERAIDASNRRVAENDRLRRAGGGAAWGGQHGEALRGTLPDMDIDSIAHDLERGDVAAAEAAFEDAVDNLPPAIRQQRRHEIRAARYAMRGVRYEHGPGEPGDNGPTGKADDGDAERKDLVQLDPAEVSAALSAWL